MKLKLLEFGFEIVLILDRAPVCQAIVMLADDLLDLGQVLGGELAVFDLCLDRVDGFFVERLDFLVDWLVN